MARRSGGQPPIKKAKRGWWLPPLPAEPSKTVAENADAPTTANLPPAADAPTTPATVSPVVENHLDRHDADRRLMPPPPRPVSTPIPAERHHPSPRPSNVHSAPSSPAQGDAETPKQASNKRSVRFASNLPHRRDNFSPSLPYYDPPQPGEPGYQPKTFSLAAPPGRDEEDEATTYEPPRPREPFFQPQTEPVTTPPPPRQEETPTYQPPRPREPFFQPQTEPVTTPSSSNAYEPPRPREPFFQPQTLPLRPVPPTSGFEYFGHQEPQPQQQQPHQPQFSPHAPGGFQPFGFPSNRHPPNSYEEHLANENLMRSWNFYQQELRKAQHLPPQMPACQGPFHQQPPQGFASQGPMNQGPFYQHPPLQQNQMSQGPLYQRPPPQQPPPQHHRPQQPPSQEPQNRQPPPQQPPPQQPPPQQPPPQQPLPQQPPPQQPPPQQPPPQQPANQQHLRQSAPSQQRTPQQPTQQTGQLRSLAPQPPPPSSGNGLAGAISGFGVLVSQSDHRYPTLSQQHTGAWVQEDGQKKKKGRKGG